MWIRSGGTLFYIPEGNFRRYVMCTANVYGSPKRPCSGRVVGCFGRVVGCSGLVVGCSGRVVGCSGRVVWCSGRVVGCFGRVVGCSGRVVGYECYILSRVTTEVTQFSLLAPLVPCYFLQGHQHVGHGNIIFS